MKKELTILIAWHNETDKKKIECFEKNRQSFVEFNPGVDVISIISPFADPKEASLRADLTIFLWFKENYHQVNSERFLLIEWDCWCDVNIKDYYKRVWDLDVIAPSVLYHERDFWYWFKTLFNLPERARPYATGIIPFCGILVSERAMKAICEEIINPEYLGANSELRFATIATMLGFDPVPNPVCSRITTWKAVIPFNSNYKGLHHPRKVLTTPNTLKYIDKKLQEKEDNVIPKIIHQTWKENPPPQQFNLLIDSWRTNHPDWDYILWTDEMNREFIGRFFPDFLLQYDSYEDKIQRVDAVRYFILYKIGGLYVDIDFQCIKNIEPLLEDAECIFGAEPIEHYQEFYMKKIISNAFMASKPNSAFFKTICDSLTSYTWRDRTFLENILSTTGAFALTDIYDNYEGKSEVKVLSPDKIYPLAVNEAHDVIFKGLINEEVKLKIENAYAVHYFMSSWNQ